MFFNIFVGAVIFPVKKILILSKNMSSVIYMTKIKILHRFLNEGETVSVDAKATLQIPLRKIQKMFKFTYKTFGTGSQIYYNCYYDLPCSLHNDFTQLQIIHDLDITKPIQLTDSVITKTNIKSECGHDDATLMDDCISYLEINGNCDNVDKTKRRINKLVTRKFYSTLINDKDCALNILSKMYIRNTADFNDFPKDNSREHKFPFKKDDKILFILTIVLEGKKRDYLVTLKIV